MRTSFWAKVLISCLIYAILPDCGIAQDKDDLIDKLSAPLWLDRYEAAVELSAILTENEYIRIYEDDTSAFWELSAAGIPTGGKLESILLSSESPALAADVLLKAGRISLMDSRPYEYHRVVDEMRNQWFGEWQHRISLDPANGEMIRYISKKPWLKQFFFDKKKWNIRPDLMPWSRWRTVCSIILALDPSIALDDDDGMWLKTLRACMVSDKNLMASMEFNGGVGYADGLAERLWSGEFCYTTHAELICIVLDRPQWLIDIAPKLRKSKHFEWNDKRFDPVPIEVNRLNDLIYISALAGVCKIDTLQSEIEKYIASVSRVPLFTDDFVVGNYWMDAAVGDKKFCDWYYENVKPTRLVAIDRLRILK